MCDYCDCRSAKEIAELSADHEQLLELLGQLGRAVRADDESVVPVVLAEVAAILLPHAAREERGVFHQLRVADIDGAYLDRFEDDHHRVHALLDADGSDWRGCAADLIELLEDHIFREETDLFPVARAVLPPSAWDAIESNHHTGEAA